MHAQINSDGRRGWLMHVGPAVALSQNPDTDEIIKSYRFQLFWQRFSGNSATPKEESTEGLGRRFMSQSPSRTDPGAGRGGGCAWRGLQG